MAKIYAKLRRIRQGREIDDGLREAIVTLARILEVVEGPLPIELETSVDALDEYCGV